MRESLTRVPSNRIVTGKAKKSSYSATEGGLVVPAAVRVALGAFLPLLLAAPLAAQGAPARVALVLDQDSPRFQPLVEQFQTEVRGFFRPGEITLLPPVAGDGSSAGIQRVLQRALGDSSVAVVVTLGGIGSHLLARAGARPSRPSPAPSSTRPGRTSRCGKARAACRGSPTSSNPIPSRARWPTFIG